MKCSADIEAERLKDLDLGFYYCWIKNKRTDELSLDIIELVYSRVSEHKFFKINNLINVISFEKINQKPPKLPKEKIRPIPTLDELLLLAASKWL
mgnify:CR=1 FL=1